MESKLMTTNAPTTGAIVRALRNCADATAKKKPCTPECYYFNRTECCAGSLYDNAADRLESQEREIAELTGKNDVEIEEWNEPCELCEHHNSTHGICGNCYSTENFELRKDCRGLPQDGEGNERQDFHFNVD